MSTTDPQSVTLTRQELYEKVWAEPMRKVATTLGLSDVGLKKMCRKLDIPTPCRGYWQKKRNGITVRRTPLPALKEEPTQDESRRTGDNVTGAVVDKEVAHRARGRPSGKDGQGRTAENEHIPWAQGWLGQEGSELDGGDFDLHQSHRFPEEHELIDALEDTYHDLFIGPCTEAEVAAEAGCRLIQQIGTVSDDQFDCTYARWTEMFRDEVYRVASERAAQGSTDGSAPHRKVSRDVALKRLFDHTREIVLDGEVKIARRAKVWVIIEEDSVVCELFPMARCKETVERDPPPVEFPSPEEAYVAYTRAHDEWVAVRRRYHKALERLEARRKPGRPRSSSRT